MGAVETRQLLQMCFGAHLSRAIGNIADIGLADKIGENETRSISDLASETGCHERTLYRVMRYTSSYGVFEEKGNWEFGHTDLSRALRSDAHGSFRPAAQLFNWLFQGLGEFDHTLKTEQSGMTRHLGQPVFEYLPNNPDKAAMFDAAMPSFHGGETEAMLEAYDFSDIGMLADVGGGGGTLIATALQHYPSMNGLLFDLDHVIGRAKPGLEEAGVADRCQTVEGSFFDFIPDGADAYLMRHIIHDWSDEESVEILKNCRKAVPADGRLLIVETIVPEGNDRSPAKEMDITMLLYPGGLERTENEYRDLFAASGFRLDDVTPTSSMVNVIEGRPV
jgi:hypothetical protein